jgi:solute carrier family 25 carnitine/acylcarnitine transporter 20/29
MYIYFARQVDSPWKLTEIFHGSSTTILRNAFLFSSFVVYMDLSKLYIPGGLGDFMTGGLCATMAWLTIWPFDVVKTRRQSGEYKNQSIMQLLSGVYKDGYLFRGLGPGLARSVVANGCSMVVYKKVEFELKKLNK